jgi:hypothetical protein
LNNHYSIDNRHVVVQGTLLQKKPIGILKVGETATQYTAE